jgi:hypothetical protein
MDALLRGIERDDAPTGHRALDDAGRLRETAVSTDTARRQHTI